MWHCLTAHGGTSQGGFRAFAIVPVLGDSDGEDMPALVGYSDGEDMPELFFSDSDEEDIHAPPGPAAAAGGFANPGHRD